MNFKLSPDTEGIGRGLEILEEKLKGYGLKQKQITKSMLAAEEVMTALLEHSGEADLIQLSIRRFFDEISIEIAVAGKEFSFENSLSFGSSLETEDLGPDAERTIRNMILRSVVEDLKYRNRNGVNTVRITVSKSKRALRYKTGRYGACNSDRCFAAACCAGGSLCRPE